MKYLMNCAFKLQIVFIVAFLMPRYSKLDPKFIRFNKKKKLVLPKWSNRSQAILTCAPKWTNIYSHNGEAHMCFYSTREQRKTETMNRKENREVLKHKKSKIKTTKWNKKYGNREVTKNQNRKKMRKSSRWGKLPTRDTWRNRGTPCEVSEGRTPWKLPTTCPNQGIPN